MGAQKAQVSGYERRVKSATNVGLSAGRPGVGPEGKDTSTSGLRTKDGMQPQEHPPLFMRGYKYVICPFEGALTVRTTICHQIMDYDRL